MDNLNIITDSLEIIHYTDLIDFINNTEFLSENTLIHNKQKKNVFCQYKSCNKFARYGLIKRTPIYCRMHKPMAYTDVLAKTCKEKNCPIQPSFGYLNKPIEYCKKHSLVGMINLKSKLCTSPACTNRAYYGYPYNKIEYCINHYKYGMVNIKSKKYKGNIVVV